MGRKQLSRAEKIRRFLKKNPTMPLKDVAVSFNTTYQVVYMIKRGMEGKKYPIVKDKVTKLTPNQAFELAHKLGGPKNIGEMIEKAQDARKELSIQMVEPKPDPVNHPAHYKVGGIETIDYIKAKLTPEEFRGYLKGNLLKYSSRIGHKGSAQLDAGKAGWYANALVQAIDPATT